MIRVYFTKIITFTQQGVELNSMLVDCLFTQKLNDFETLVFSGEKDFFRVHTKNIEKTTPI